jgi:hypothetical protein
VNLRALGGLGFFRLRRETGLITAHRQRTLSWMEPNGSLTKLSGSSSAVERQLPKLDVTGSIPVSRSTLQAELENKKRKSILASSRRSLSGLEGGQPGWCPPSFPRFNDLPMAAGP